ncbi:MAG: type VI secretion system baseplate subunit TssK [Bryobacteraceae bacterium]
MRHLQPVLWTKGTLLSPQHLQLQDRFLEDSLRFRLEALSYCPWGFRDCRLDREALAAGMFSLTVASGIFPDGLLFDIPASDTTPPQRSLDQHFTPETKSVDVYLAVPNYREQGANVSVTKNGALADTRYIAEAIAVRDEVKGEAERPVQIARKGFRFLFEGESRQGYSTLRIARVLRAPSGEYSFDESFIPPLLDFRSNETLVTIARRLVEILGAKSTELAALRRHKNQSLADFTSSDIASFWLLYTINAFFPDVRHLFEVRGGHPEELFAVLVALAGSLTTFSKEIHPRDLPVYDHDRLEECFPELDVKLRQLLETVVPRNFVSLAFKQIQPSIYAVPLADERYFTNTRLYLAVRADMDHGDLIARGPQMIKVSSANQIDSIVRHAVSGLGMTHVVRPPSSLPVRLNYEYFALQQQGEHWASIFRSRNLAAYVPAEFPSAELELLILLPEAVR